MTWLAIPLLAASGPYYGMVVKRTGLLSAEGLFVSVQLVMALGSLALLDPMRRPDVIYGYILAYTSLCFMCVSALAHLFQPADRYTMLRRVRLFRPTPQTWILLAVSITVVALYYRSIGDSALLRGITGLVTGESEDIVALRLASYSGDRYLFPGYVNQFKNALFPALAVVIITYWFGTRRRRLLVSCLLSAGVVFALLGTGQRGSFVMFLVTCTVYSSLLAGGIRLRRRVVLAVVAIPMIVLATAAMGRTAGSASALSLADRALTATGELQTRVLAGNQEAAVVGFRYVYKQDVQAGREWGRSLSGLLPGVRGSDLANRVFREMYGSDRGTAPPSLWGSIYHNFGLPGILIAPPALAIVYANVTRRMRSSEERNTVELIGMAGAVATLGLWAAGDPVYLLNSGLIVYIVMWRWGTGRRIKNQRPVEALGNASELVPRGGSAGSLGGPL